MILRFNFSGVDSTPGRLEESFEKHCTEQFLVFANSYEHLFKPEFRQELMSRTTASDRLQYLNNTASELGLRIYLVIDEYDNFTNTILSTYGKDAYRQATHGEGFFHKNIRTDYNKLRHLIRIDHELGENFSVIREIIETGRTSHMLICWK